MNNSFIEQSAAEGAQFLDKKYSSNIEKSSTNSTSSTSKAFKAIYPAPKQHYPALKAAPSIKRNALVEEIETKEGTRNKLLIESKAAEIFKESLDGYLACDIDSQTWHSFTGSHWQALESAQLVDSVLVELLYQGTGELGFRPTYKNGIKSLLADGNMLPLPKTNRDKLPFLNGLLDLGTKRLHTITPDNARTWCLPYAYKSNADCPNVKAWLKQAVDGDMEIVEFLQAWMAAVLHGRSDLQKFLHLKGSGGTGKGVFMRLHRIGRGTKHR